MQCLEVLPIPLSPTLSMWPQTRTCRKSKRMATRPSPKDKSLFLVLFRVPRRQINFHVSIGNSDAVLLNTLEIAFSCYCGRKFNTGSIYYTHLHSISVNFLGNRAYCFYCAVDLEIQIAQNSANHPREHLMGLLSLCD